MDTDRHDLTTFDCGEPALNDWLRNRAVSNERSGALRTYVLCSNNELMGYYCLSTGGIDREDAPGTLRRNMPDPVPVLVLSRLAVDRGYQNRGSGARCSATRSTVRCKWRMSSGPEPCWSMPSQRVPGTFTNPAALPRCRPSP